MHALAPLLLLWQTVVVVGAAAAEAAAPPPPPVSPAVPLRSGQRQLMIDRALLDEETFPSVAVEMRMHAPRKTGEVIIEADQPWEGVIFYYDSIVQVSDIEFRIYYDAFGPLGRFMCVAISNDTLTWTKPALGLVSFQNSTANNIILGAGGYIEPGTVFIDKNPSVAANQRYKMVATFNGGATMFSSPDGFKFTPMTAAPSLRGSDTQVIRRSACCLATTVLLLVIRGCVCPLPFCCHEADPRLHLR